MVWRRLYLLIAVAVYLLSALVGAAEIGFEGQAPNAQAIHRNSLVNFLVQLGGVGAALVVIGLGVLAEMLARFLMHFVWPVLARPHGGLKRVFDYQNAPIWSNNAADAISHCDSGRIREPLKRLTIDRKHPYRILKGFAPAPDFFFRRPLKFERKARFSNGRAQIARRLFEIDILCGGLLRQLDAAPESRFIDRAHGDSVAVDLYWRNDVQEMPDALQSDMLLRFHQSTIERPNLSTCRYKTYAAIKNFRRSPILLVRVKDVVDCLRNDHVNTSLIYQGLSAVNQSNVLRVLQEPAYERFPPRIDRVRAQQYDPHQGPVLFENEHEVDDWAMMFDPARVWVPPESESAQRHIEAIVALRNAIHLVSREQAVEIVLDKRDVLVVDNLRALVARQEDGPSWSLRDSLAHFRESLESRWLRKIYGFPPNTDMAEASFKAKVYYAGDLQTPPDAPH